MRSGWGDEGTQSITCAVTYWGSCACAPVLSPASEIAHLWAKHLLTQPGTLPAAWLLQERGLSAHPSPSRAAAMPGCSRACTGRKAELWEAPGAEHFDSQKSNYRAADYRANKIPLCYFGE